MNLKIKELERYSRQIIIKDIGISGQKKIKNSKVLIVGNSFGADFFKILHLNKDLHKIVRLIFYKNGFIFNNNKIQYYDNINHRTYLEEILKGNLPIIDGNNNYKLSVVNNSNYNYK